MHLGAVRRCATGTLHLHARIGLHANLLSTPPRVGLPKSAQTDSACDMQGYAVGTQCITACVCQPWTSREGQAAVQLHAGKGPGH